MWRVVVVIDGTPSDRWINQYQPTGYQQAMHARKEECEWYKVVTVDGRLVPDPRVNVLVVPS